MENRKIFEPLVLKNQTLINRFVMGSMHTGLEDKLIDLEALTSYFVSRAKTDIGLIITGGYSPNRLGRLTPFAGTFNSKKMAKAHRKLTEQVHASGKSKIILQLLHAGRYSYHPLSVAPSRIKSPITPFTPFALPEFAVRSTVQDFVKAASLAKDAGYDGVEIMGSEGYLLHQFFSPRTNKRTDQWGGNLENRCRFATEIIKQTRALLGVEFLIVFRIPILDLLEDGSPWSEIEHYAKTLQAAGVDILNSGIGWHESRVPTIGSMVPEAAFSTITQKLKQAVQIPVIATNRFSQPESIEMVLQNGHADLVSMARPFLADPEFVEKTKSNRISQINPCIACNQACLDHIFSQKRASCLVNPTACEETKWTPLLKPASSSKKIAVVGAGVAGLNAALVLLKSGHDLTIFEKSSDVGGQFQLAALIPGKKDYARSLIHWKSEIERLGGKILFSSQPKTFSGFDHVIISTGVTPRKPKIPGVDLSHVVTYDQFLKNQTSLGKNIVIIGAGGIAVDVATSIFHRHSDLDTQYLKFFKHWNIDSNASGGLTPQQKIKPDTSVTLLQRSKKGFGQGLGKTTGWIHRLDLKRHGLQFFNDLEYQKITAQSVEVKFSNGEIKSIPADQVIICAGQEPVINLKEILMLANIPFTVIGGARLAGELDAKRAIREAFELVHLFKGKN